MYNKEIQTHLIKKESKFPSVCTQCSSHIPVDSLFYREEGVKEHLHSLIARKFCVDCYSQFGETALLTGKTKEKK